MDASRMPVETLPLRDIHLPEAISWWPPAPGWWLLLLVAAVLVASFLVYRHVRRRRVLKRTALAELATIRQRYQQDGDAIQLIQALSALMRRASISFYQRSNTASLTGNRWLRYLDSTAERKDFERGDGRILATAPYLPLNSRLDVNADDLLALCEDWLRLQPVKGIAP